MSETPNPYTSDKKKKPLMELYKKGNFPKQGKQPKKVNLASADELDNATLATKHDFKKRLDNKPTANISNVVIPIPTYCNQVQIIPLSSLNIFDTSNPGKSIRNEKYLNNLCAKLTTNTYQEKIVVLGGDLFGWQWKMSELAKADITQDNKVLWFGINLRLKELVRITTMLLKTGAHVVLMRGAQENRIMKVLDGRDVIEELIETIKSNDKIKNCNLYYVNEGVSEIIQLAKLDEKGKTTYYPIELRTNNALSKATSVKGYLAASQKNNGQAYSDILSIDFNGNISGQIDKNHISVSPNKTYKETPVGKKPPLASKTNNELSLFLETDGSISVVQGDSSFLTTNNTAEQELSEKIARNRGLFNIATDKIRLEQFEAYKNIVTKK